MPWTRKQVKKLLSSGSPLTPAQKTKMRRELHANPALGHGKKGHLSELHSYDSNRPKRKFYSRYGN